MTTHTVIAREEHTYLGDAWCLYLDDDPANNNAAEMLSGLGLVKTTVAKSYGYAGRWRRDGDTWTATWTCDPDACQLDHDEEG